MSQPNEVRDNTIPLPTPQTPQVPPPLPERAGELGYRWLNCEDCKTWFLAKRHDAETCSPSCRWRLWVMRNTGRVPRRRTHTSRYR